MGLYLCVFDEEGLEIDGIDVGSYADFNSFREKVAAVVENGKSGSECPILNTHLDSDGEWSPAEAAGLLLELERIYTGFANAPPVELDSDWKRSLVDADGLKVATLLDCFFDVDGVPLVARIFALAQLSVTTQQPILFQ
jgi:hypothetical protein